MHCTEVHYRELHYTGLHYTELHYTELLYTELHYTELHYTELICKFIVLVLLTIWFYFFDVTRITSQTPSPELWL